MENELNVQGGLELETEVFGLNLALNGGVGYHFEHVSTATTVKTVEDNSHVEFSLADDDGGDFFVVQLYKDPYYGVPLFYTGARPHPQ